jgi:IS605 OrfB family transposase
VFSLLVSLTVEVADPDLLKTTRVTGVDVGHRVLATVAGIDTSARFHRDERRRQAKDTLARLKKELQRKDTRKFMDSQNGKRPRSTGRRLRAIDRRERRLTLDTRHRISRSITEDNPNTPIGVEDLTDIRERTDGRKFKKASNKRKKSNKQRSTWPFAELRSLLTYKATFNGSVVIAVDADYTSQGCPKCGHTSRADLPARG